MKILFLCNSTRISGAEVSLLLLLDGLDAEKYQVVVAVPGQGDLYEKLVSKYPVKVFPLKRYKRTKNVLAVLIFLMHSMVVSFRIARYVRRERIDLIYANNLQSQLYSIMVKMLTGRKNIWHARDNSPGRLTTKLFAWLSAHVICISEFIYRQIPAYGHRKSCIPNGIDSGDWQPERPGKMATSGARYKLTVGMVGQLIPWKRHMDLILAAEGVIDSFPNVQFLFIGEEPDNHCSGYKLFLEEAIACKGLEEYFHFAGFERSIKERISELNVLVHCADREPFGRVIIEAMALEKAVIACNTGGPAEIIVNGHSGILIGPGDIGLLAEKILFLLQNEEIRTALGKEARKRVIQNYSARDTAKGIQKVMESLI